MVAHKVKQRIGGRYVLRREVARGPQSELFEAVHLYTRRVVAVKTLCGDALADEQTRQNLILEAQLLSTARHPNILQVLDAGETTPGDPFMVTEMLQGRTLDGVLASRGHLRILDTLDMAIALCEALHHAHLHDIVHASLSPSSVFFFARSVAERASDPPLSARPDVKLLDFGLTPNPTTTIEGPLGAMGYAPPELLQGDPPQPATDVYALGVIVYECLLGELPALTEDSSSLTDSLCRRVPQTLAEAILVALQPLGQRYRSALEFAEALEDAKTPPSSQRLQPKRRRAARAPYVTPVSLERADGTMLEARSEDISEGGMLIVATEEIVIGSQEQIHVSFALPSTGAFIRLAAAARWIRSGRANAGAIGVEFDNPPPTVVADIAEHVATFSDEIDAIIDNIAT